MTVSIQPLWTSAPSLDCYHAGSAMSEKECSEHGAQWVDEAATHGRRCRCEGAKAGAIRRRILAAILLTLFSIVSLLLISCLYDAFFNEGSWLHSLGFGEDGPGIAFTAMAGLIKRQSQGSGGAAGNNGNVFIDRKYYLIVIFVGLFLVILAAICLSAWCCKGAFQNPLCCPCYLCACCGGLACLNCLACGLCGDALEQM